MSPSAAKNIVGNRAAKQIAYHAAKGTAIGLVFAFAYKFTVSDVQRNEVEKFYANYKEDTGKK